MRRLHRRQCAATGFTSTTLDGLRLDATHALFDSSPRHFVEEMVEAVHRAAVPPPLVFAEDHRNLATMIEPSSSGGWGLDGVWADDFHHVVRRMLGGEDHGYFVDYRGDAFELADTLRRGWLYTGECVEARGRSSRHRSLFGRRCGASVICVRESRPDRQPRVRRSSRALRRSPRPGAPPSRCCSPRR